MGPKVSQQGKKNKTEVAYHRNILRIAIVVVYFVICFFGGGRGDKQQYSVQGEHKSC